MSKIATLLLFLISIQFQTFAQNKSVQDSIKHFADSTFLIFEKSSLYADKINWGKRKQSFFSETKNITAFRDVLPVFQKIFDDLEDHHSFFWYNNQKYASNFGQLAESSIRKPLLTALENGKGKVSVEVIDNVGYILVPQDNTSDDFNEMQRSAQRLQDSICSIYDSHLKGWIIDLRLNTGGNMYPMIAGILPFLEKGTFASIIDRHGAKKDWKISEKAIYEGDEKITELKTKCLPTLTSCKVVVLISEITGSSGEITALSLLNRPNTYFIGEPTAGYMTSNELFRLPFGTFFLLTSAYETDNKGQITRLIKPDLLMVEGDNFDDLSQDLKVIEGIKWIK